MLASETPIGLRLMSLLGILVFIFLGWLVSVDRKAITWRPVFWGVALQFIFGLIVLHPSMQSHFFGFVNGAVNQLLSFAEAGATFVLGTMEAHEVTTVNLQTGEKSQDLIIGSVHPSFKNVAFWIILPTIIFFSSLMAILYQMGIMQRIVWGIAWVMQRTMGTTGPESLSAAANIFVGQTEAPLVIKPYIDRMSPSELHAVMTGGFATVAGGVMAAYVGFLQNVIPDIAGHVVAASIMSAPAALAISKVIYPMAESQKEDDSPILMTVDKPYSNIVEAAAAGASEGMTLVLNVLAMLIAFVGLIAMFNWGLGLIVIGETPLSMELILGWLFSPLAFFMGVPWSESMLVGSLLGKKLVLTEFVAYLDLAEIMSTGDQLSQRSAIIASYALCGFANFASIGIQIGGIGGIAPSRRSEIAALGIRSLIGGSLAAFMTATIAGFLIG